MNRSDDQADGALAAARRLYHSHGVIRRLMQTPVRLSRHIRNLHSRPLVEMAERVAAVIVSDVTIDVPEFGGRFRCSPKSDLFRRLILNGEYEPRLAGLFRKHLLPDRDVLDVGANIGFYSVLAGKLLGRGRVLAFEPTEAAHARLLHNLADNGVADKVIVFNGVAADQAGEAVINHVEGMEEYSSLGVIVHPSAAELRTIGSVTAAETVDSLVEQHGLAPGLIKIDVEGAEASVLRGAARTLARHRPIVLSELSPALLGPMGASAQEIVGMFHDLDYEVTDAHDKLLRPGSRDYGDILCIPR